MQADTHHLPPLDLGNNILRIDTGFYRPGLAACYLVESAGHAAFIDCGTWYSVPHLLEVLDRQGIPREKVDYVIPTHIHLDHAGSAGELMRHLPNAQLVIHPFGARHMADPARLQEGAIAVYGESEFEKAYHTLVPVDPSRIVKAPDEFEIDLYGRWLHFVDTPGHASHHFCVWDETSGGFFTGDTFGISYRESDLDGRALIFPTTTPVQFKPEKWLETLDRLMEYEPRRMYLTHFGPVEEVSRLADDLREGIRVHHQVAADCLDDPDPAAEMEKRLEAWFMEKVRAHGLDWPEEKMLALIRLDLGLNVQGLVAWQERHRREKP